MDPMAEIKASFFVECGDLLESLEEGLLQLQDGDEDPDTINAVFRAVHSIKGGAGAFGLDALVHFAHRFETVLDEARSDRLEMTSDAVRLFLKAADVLSDHVAACRDDVPMDQAKSDSTIAELEALLPEGLVESTQEEDDAVDFTPASLSLDLPPLDDAGADDLTTTITFTPHATLPDSGNEPLFLFRALASLGAVTAQLDASAVPSLADLDPTQSVLRWTLTLEGNPTDAEIMEVFEFAQGLCDVSITRAGGAADAPPLPGLPAGTEDIGPSLASMDDLPDLPPLPDLPSDDELPTKAAKTPQKTETPPAQPTPKAKAPVSAPTVRVDLDRIDRLVNLVGELVINQAMLTQSLAELGVSSSAAVASGLEELQQLTRDIQDSVMSIRAQPVKPLFQRMSRIVREAAEATGKKVRLETEGENTEIDKTVIERLADPLTHMIRNAVDHGLESPEKRAEIGKSEDGNILLRATHRSGRVVIEIEDDGAGINRPKVLQIAQEKGLVPHDAALSDAEIDMLLFMPGFSTAKEVSNLSGRGVGMDVVKRAIQALGGRISIQSEPGKGSIFSISLPLTLAVLDGMIIEVCGQTLVAPLAAITETMTLSDADIQSLDKGTRVVHNRGTFVPLLDLGTEFGYRTEQTHDDEAVVLFLSSEEGEIYALLVDAILEQRQVVIKGLADTYGYVPGVAAATILGDGKIALILDPVDLIKRATAAAGLSLAG